MNDRTSSGASGFSWSRQYGRRRAFAPRYPSVFDLPLARRPGEILFRDLDEGMRILDAGAGTGRTVERIQGRFPGMEVRTLDVDPASDPDYHDASQIDSRFDRVLLFEVLEHLPVDEGAAVLGDLLPHLAEGGRLLVTTPNVFHPSSWFRDMTHCTPIAYDELGGLLEGCGYRVLEMFRIYNAPYVQRLFRRTVGQPLHRWLGIDYARSVMAVAEAAAPAVK